jgi:hypothetical protein
MVVVFSQISHHRQEGTTTGSGGGDPVDEQVDELLAAYKFGLTVYRRADVWNQPARRSRNALKGAERSSGAGPGGHIRAGEW